MAAPVNASIVEPFPTLQDLRMARTTQPNLRAILVLAVCPLLRGGEGCQDMDRLGTSQRAWLQTFLAFPHGIPSHDTCGRVFARLHPKRLPPCFLAWPQAVPQRPQGMLVSWDGKPVRASFDRATAAAPLPMLSAWCAENGGLVLGQRKTASTANARTALPDLLQLLAITGGLVTIEAMGCQTAMAGQSRAQGGDARLALKAHHTQASTAGKPYWHQHSEPQLGWRTAERCLDALDDPHGRMGRRRVGTITDLTTLPALAQWSGLRSVMGVATIRMAHQHAAITRDSRFSLASLVRSATACVPMIRQHWDIEKKLHWSVDVTFNADRGRLRKDHAAEYRVALRHITLTLLRQESSRRRSLRQQRLFCSLDELSLLTVIARATSDAITLAVLPAVDRRSDTVIPRSYRRSGVGMPCWYRP